jgi:hypothetical protein
MTRLNLYRLTALSLAFFSFFMAGFVSNRVFERLPHLEDELAYLYQARIFAHGEIVINSPQPARAYWQPFVVDNSDTGHRFGKYTPGWPMLLSLGVIAGQPWVINAFFAALNVCLIYRFAFSPMALLLNATLMSHTSSLFFATLFIYAYWRIEQAESSYQWAIIGGFGLGVLAISRPSTALAIAFPFAIWTMLRSIRTVIVPQERSTRIVGLLRFVGPMFILSVVSLGITTLIPVFNYSAVGDAGRNLYREVWDYDRLGFGEDFGRNGHTIVKGVRHARFDLSLSAADLFGWQVDLRDGWRHIKPGKIDTMLQEHLRTDGDYWPLTGLSFFLVLIGLFGGFKSRWLWLWLVIALIWLIWPLAENMDFIRGFDTNALGERIEKDTALWQWLALGAAWSLIPFVYLIWRWPHQTQTRWTWLLFNTFIAIVAVHMAYWVGSQRYSTRYYFEALAGLTIIGAVGIDWLVRTIASLSKTAGRLLQYAGFGLFALSLVWSLYAYSTPRITALHGFNHVSQAVIDSVKVRQADGQDTLVLVNGQSGTVFWRSFGSLMAITDPYFDNDIVVAWNYAPDNPSVRQQILETFPDRQVIEMAVIWESAWFIDGVCEEGEEQSVSSDCSGA